MRYCRWSVSCIVRRQNNIPQRLRVAEMYKRNADLSKDSKNRRTNVGKKKNCDEPRNDEEKEEQLQVKSAAEDEEKRRVVEFPQLKNSR